MKPPIKTPINRPPDSEWEELIRQTASSLPYPPTPNVADATRLRLAAMPRRGPVRRLQPTLQPLWVASLILALLLGLWAMPPVRAAILEFLQIGAVRIWWVAPTPTLAPIDGPVGAEPTTTPTPTPLASLFDLAGATTLAEAEARAGFPIPLPTYPADLGAPDGVFLQEMNGPVVVLVWMNPDQPGEAAYSLQIFGSGAIVNKLNPPVVMTTTVNSQSALWTQGPYMLAYGEGPRSDWKARYLVSGHVLIWVDGELTYRLESNLSMEESVRMAESLQTH